MKTKYLVFIKYEDKLNKTFGFDKNINSFDFNHSMIHLNYYTKSLNGLRSQAHEQSSSSGTL